MKLYEYIKNANIEVIKEYIKTRNSNITRKQTMSIGYLNHYHQDTKFNALFFAYYYGKFDIAELVKPLMNESLSDQECLYIIHHNILNSNIEALIYLELIKDFHFELTQKMIIFSLKSRQCTIEFINYLENKDIDLLTPFDYIPTFDSTIYPDSMKETSTLDLVFQSQNIEVIDYIIDKKIPLKNLDSVLRFFTQNINCINIKALDKFFLLLNNQKLIQDCVLKIYNEILYNSYCDHISILTILIKYIENIDFLINDSRDTLLIKAVQSDSYTITKFLIDNGADINHNNVSYDTPILIAIRQKNIEICSLLLSDDSIDITKSDNKNNTVLMLIAQSEENMINIAEQILVKNIDIDHQNLDGDTALIIAIRYNQKDIISTLIKLDVDQTIKNKKKKSAYDIAKSNKNSAILKTLTRLI